MKKESSLTNPLSYEVLITRVIDGDTYVGIKKQVIESSQTLKVIIEQKIKIRLYGVDTPEIRGKKKTQKGLDAKKYCKELLQGKSFIYKFTGKKDSFGRELGDIILSGDILLSQHLITIGYARTMKK